MNKLGGDAWRVFQLMASSSSSSSSSPSCSYHSLHDVSFGREPKQRKFEDSTVFLFVYSLLLFFRHRDMLKFDPLMLCQAVTSAPGPILHETTKSPLTQKSVDFRGSASVRSQHARYLADIKSEQSFAGVQSQTTSFQNQKRPASLSNVENTDNWMHTQAVKK